MEFLFAAFVFTTMMRVDSGLKTNVGVFLKLLGFNDVLLLFLVFHSCRVIRDFFIYKLC